MDEEKKFKIFLDDIDKEYMGIIENSCLHYKCEECHGTGKKEDGSPCVHYIACNCPKCRIYV